MAEHLNFETHVEILLKQNSLAKKDHVNEYVAKFLLTQSTARDGDTFAKFEEPYLTEHVDSISISRSPVEVMNGAFPRCHYYVYSFNSTAPEVQEFEENEQISTQWILPTQDFHGLWETLIYDTNVKDELLNYVSTSLLFSEKKVDPNVVSWNRLVLLHGPPGTGKTSLCKALAQKVCIRFSSKFSYGHLVEVNTHSLFSKWFSESGKLVSKMFHSILTMIEDPKVMVIVLLDEVETLARSRASALSGNEPSDALRVVNALLTHLDMIKRFPNVLILTTSNITEAIDVALVDRADIKHFIGLPSVRAIYHIYYSCIKELIQAGVICTSGNFVSLYAVNEMPTDEVSGSGAESMSRSMKLKYVSEQSVGLSGRSLRRMPFIACSLFIKAALNTTDVFLEALSQAVDKHWADVKNLKVHV